MLCVCIALEKQCLVCCFEHTHWYWTGFSENWRITPEIVYKLPGWFKGKSAGSPELIAGEGGQKPWFPASFPLSWSIDKQSTVEFFSTSGKSVHCSHQPRWWRASAPSELPEIYGKRTAVFFSLKQNTRLHQCIPIPASYRLPHSSHAADHTSSTETYGPQMRSADETR